MRMIRRMSRSSVVWSGVEGAVLQLHEMFKTMDVSKRRMEDYKGGRWNY